MKAKEKYEAIKEGKKYIDEGKTPEEAFTLLTAKYEFLYADYYAVKKQLEYYYKLKHGF